MPSKPDPLSYLSMVADSCAVATIEGMLEDGNRPVVFLLVLADSNGIAFRAALDERVIPNAEKVTMALQADLKALLKKHLGDRVEVFNTSSRGDA